MNVHKCFEKRNSFKSIEKIFISWKKKNRNIKRYLYIKIKKYIMIYKNMYIYVEKCI